MRNLLTISLSVVVAANLLPGIALAQTDILGARLKATVQSSDPRLVNQAPNLPSRDRMLSAPLASKASEPGFLNLMIRSRTPDAAAASIRAYGGSVKVIADSGVLTAKLSRNRVMDLVRSGLVDRIELARQFQPLNDDAIAHVRADEVHAGTGGLTQGYSGEGVIVGVIDTGIDFRHMDFRDPDDPSKSRILAIWDQNDYDGTPPDGHSYGTLWTNDQIEADLAAGTTTVRQTDKNGHGTHVTGTAAGNGSAVGAHRGMAYEADIIMVATDWYTTGIVDAAAFIYELASSLGRPVVINASLGGHSGPHDGSTLEDLALNALVAARPARAFIAAAGNEGEALLHWGGFQLESTPQWGYLHPWQFQQDSGGYFSLPYYSGVVPTNRVEEIEIQIAADSAGSFWNPRFESRLADEGEWHSIARIRDGIPTQWDFNMFVRDSLFYQNGELAGTVVFFASQLDERNTEVGIMIEDVFWADGTTDAGWPDLYGLELWRVRIRGTGSAHFWRNGSVVMSADPVGDYGTSIDDRFVPADNDFSVGVPATAARVVAVGAYTNRKTDKESVGELAPFSSRGPTADGRLKPEIAAPGHKVFSTLSSDKNMEGQEYKLAPEGLHWYLSGTSMATPVVTGAVALLMQQRPDLDDNQIRSLLIDNAAADSDTGPLPNNDWGYGKLDILATMLAAEQPSQGATPSIPSFTSAMPDTSAWALPGTLKFRYQATDSDGDELMFYLQDAPWEAEIDSDTGEFEWSPKSQGTYLISVFVSDGEFATPTTSLVTVSMSPNEPPVFSLALPDTTVASFESLSYSFEVTDSNEDDVSISLVAAPDSVSFFALNPQQVRAEMPASGFLSWFVQPQDIGSHEITLSATDGSSTTTTTATVTVLHTGPSFTSVLSDTTVAPGSALRFQYEISYPGLLQTSFALSNGPITASIDDYSGWLRWTPTEAEIGNHEITVSTTDGHVSSETTATVMVMSVPNDAPVFSSVLPDTTISEGSSLFFIYGATDADDDILNYSLTSGPASVKLSGTALTWTPTDSDLGDNEITVSVSDGKVSVETTATVTVATSASLNNPPVFTRALPDTTIVAASPFLFFYEATDADADFLSYSANSVPSSAVFSEFGDLLWESTEADVGEHIVVVTVSDGIASVTTSATITVLTGSTQNTAPVFVSALPDTTILADWLFFHWYEVSDPDWDILVYSLDEGPKSAVFDTTTGFLEWEPAVLDAGEHVFTVTVSDPFESVTTTATVTVNAGSDVAPEFISALPDTSIMAGRQFSFRYAVFDANFDPVSFNLEGGPTRADFDASLGVLSWSPNNTEAGVHTIQVSASDGSNQTTTSAIVTVEAAPNVAPVFTSTLPDTTASVGTKLAYQFEAQDANGDNLNYAVQRGPVSATIDRRTGLFGWTPESEAVKAHTVVVQVSDGIATRVTTTVITVVSNVSVNSNELPTVIELGPAYPNPVNTSTTIPLALPGSQEVHMTVHDVLGRQVLGVNPGRLSAGRHRIGLNTVALVSGVYHFVLRAGNRRLTGHFVRL